MLTSELKNKLQKSLDFLSSELVQLRTGRATPSIIEDIEVDAYGAKMTIKELGSTTLLDSQNLIFSAWDRGLMGGIAKAIRNSDLKLNPVEESDRLRIPVPALTEDRRIEFTKIVSEKAEEAKNSMRSIRQDAMKDIEKDFTSKSISEDEKFTNKEEVEKLVKEFTGKVEEIAEDKRQDLMKI